MKSKNIPRGIRNNNPLNIRIGNTWLGEEINPTETEFEQFVSMKYGIRAGFCILRRYIRLYHRNNVASIISSWAPSSENNTQKYIDFVAERMNIDPLTPLDYADQEKMTSLVDAMIHYECGQSVPMKTIIEGYKAA